MSIAAASIFSVVEGKVHLTPMMKEYIQADSSGLYEGVPPFQKVLFQPHFDNTKKEIHAAVQGLEGRAVVLGIGYGFDVPLDSLAKKFREIFLVDITLEYTKKAVAKLPLEDQSKFHLVEADLTGVFSAFAHKIDTLAAQHLSPPLFISEVLKMLPSLPKTDYPYPKEGASFVCSSLVCSQLSEGPRSYLERVWANKYGTSSKMDPKSTQAFDEWLVKLQEDHLKEIHQLVSPSGKVYFAEHYSAKIEILIPGGLRNTVSSWDYPEAKKIQTLTKQLFATQSQKTWTWSTLIQSTGVALSLLTYDVTASVLSRK